MKKLTALLISCTSLLFMGCHNYDAHYDVSYHEDVVAISLAEIDIIDSYGHSSNASNHFLPALNPYIDDGFFEILWLVYSHVPYSVEFFVGRSPNILQARSVYTQSCERGGDASSSCGELSQERCFYTPSLELHCGGLKDAYETEQRSYIGDLIHQLPQSLYFFVEVCEQVDNSCEYDVRELVFE